MTVITAQHQAPAPPPGAPTAGSSAKALRSRRRYAIRAGGLSLRVDLRSTVVGAALLATLVAAVLASLAVGTYDLSLAEAARAVLGGGDPGTAFVVRELRLPRVVTGVLVGAALGASGALLQSLTRNPLGSPDVLGLTYGASAGAVLVIVAGGATSGAAIAAGALTGGLGTAVLVTALAWRHGLQTARLVLVGVGVAFTVRAAVDFLLFRANLDEVTQAAVWLTGSLNARTWDDATRVGLAVALLGPLAVALSRALDSLALGDETAAALGTAVQRTKISVALVSVGLASCAVTAAGPVAFVAVAAGPVARRLAGLATTAVVPAALTGAVLVTVADVIAEDLLPVVLPVGVVTAVAGAPILLWLLARQIRAGVL